MSYDATPTVAAALVLFILTALTGMLTLVEAFHKRDESLVNAGIVNLTLSLAGVLVTIVTLVNM